jgi:hypothetical protein
MNEEKKEKDVILIVGDWVMDEYWFLVRHHSDISSHTGFVHYRMACEKGDIVAGLCASGHVARVLYHLRADEDENYQLMGLGKWHEDDTEFIGHLIHAREQKDGKSCPSACTSFILKPQLCKEEPKIKLITLKNNSPTIRVVRLYHHENGGIDQINRIDWEPEKNPNDDEDYKLDELKLPQKEQVKFIVIHDSRKGVITEQLIRNLNEKYPNARWFVRSKDRNPEWLKIISESLEIFLIGPEVASIINPWDNWIRSGKLTKESLKIIEMLPGRNVILISNQHEVIIRANKNCFTGKSGYNPNPITQLGWPSAFFASLIHMTYKRGKDFNKEDIEKALQWSDKYGGVPIPKKSGVIKVEKRDKNVLEYEWEKEVEEWEQARKKFGFIENKENKSELYLEVWRGSTQLPGYITMIDEKHEIINRIGRNLKSFASNESPTRSLSIMLQADPGSGKTLLAKTLAKAFNFSFIRYDVTQMIHRDEMLDLFDNVATTQVNVKGKVLVFVDEINALLDAAHAYGAFLAPLEEGIYIRRGKYFSLKPCVWIFAGTKLDEEDLSSGEKLSDFKSRMMLIESIDFKSLSSNCKDTNRLQNQARLEQVYLGATLIKHHYSDVHEISKEVLQQFFILDPSEAPARRIAKMASALRNVQYGRITRKNCTYWENVQWPDKEEKMVKLIF